MEVLVRGHPRDAKKVPLTGAGRLRECKNTELFWELRKTGLRGRPFVACENIRFSSLFAAGDVSRETSPAAKSEEKRMFSQARPFVELFV